MQFDFNFSSNEPLYLQVAKQIEEAIFMNGFSEGDQVPSTTEISRQFHINPATVLKGMNILVSEEIIEKHRGLGMFVKKNAQERIRMKRQNEFFDDYVSGMVVEAQKLKLTEKQLIEMIERGYEKNE
ncbi:GntR family transcriptional regulator [Secundilactobacillus malefermentans]|uniref:GntR family transcriptional regulator n=1 Tax=Secundilactobacillus malefermentans TaxID=176292 RepID=UPI0002490741|nr:GntR family transcriptional regulator [Secundilactobacillus malefermentans]KRM58007.1 transcription regulator [Secundilactobacillus malefermentans DSM 5705 = KCTC 3548]QEA32166.1 GntR family transcriptional regulator [Secundilactobacillus malefermentans]